MNLKSPIYCALLTALGAVCVSAQSPPAEMDYAVDRLPLDIEIRPTPAEIQLLDALEEDFSDADPEDLLYPSIILKQSAFPVAHSSLPGIRPAAGISVDYQAPAVSALQATNRQRSALRELLGERRWQDIENARFDLHLLELDPNYWNADLFGPPDRYDRVRGTYRSNFSKIIREWTEARIGWDRLEERYDARRERVAERAASNGRVRVRMSPSLRGGSDTLIGMKFRLAGTQSVFISRLDLESRYRFDDDATILRLSYSHGMRDVNLQLVSGDDDYGDIVEIFGRFSF